MNSVFLHLYIKINQTHNLIPLSNIFSFQRNLACGQQRPGSLPPIPNLTAAMSLETASKAVLRYANRVIKIQLITIHFRSLTGLRSHLFFMRLDWVSSPGLPCEGPTVFNSITFHYKRKYFAH